MAAIGAAALFLCRRRSGAWPFTGPALARFAFVTAVGVAVFGVFVGLRLFIVEQFLPLARDKPTEIGAVLRHFFSW